VRHAVLQDPAAFRFLTCLDEDLATATRLGGRRCCAGPLPVAREPAGCGGIGLIRTDRPP
jgi:hypothetical protein